MNRFRRADAAFKWSYRVAMKVIFMTGAVRNENWEASRAADRSPALIQSTFPARPIAPVTGGVPYVVVTCYSGIYVTVYTYRSVISLQCVYVSQLPATSYCPRHTQDINDLACSRARRQ